MTLRPFSTYQKQTMPKPRKRYRLWIEDFRITDTEINRTVLQAMRDWKDKRERPQHFINAIRLYLALVDGDLDEFYGLLMEFLPRTAFQMMRSGPAFSSSNGNGHRAPAKSVSAPVVIESANAGENAVDDFLSGLGLNNNF